MDAIRTFAPVFPEVLPGIISRNKEMQKLALQARKIAASNASVFINGETGTGKELFAKAIHQVSGRPGELISVNCSAIPENLFESLFFGHEKGAFTGADKKQQGFFFHAGEGTLFLDEVAELPLNHQAKLLRVLEERQFSRVGSAEKLAFTGRIISASHVALEEQVAARLFREDLWYRLNLFELTIPPLNQRREDIPLLAKYFTRTSSDLILLPCALELLQYADWPGNIRQLKNTIEKVSVLAESREISATALQHLSLCEHGVDWATRVALEIIDLPINNKVKTINDALFKQAVEASNGNKSEAARLLGVHRKVVERRLAQMQTVG